MKHAHFILFLLILFSGISGANAGRIRYEGSDQLKSSQTPDGTIIEFIGNVRFVKDSSNLSSDYAVLYESKQFVRLLGNVRIRQPQQTLGADSLHFDQKTEITKAWGQVVVEDQQRHVRVTGTQGIFLEKEEAMFMTGAPQLIVDYDMQRIPTIINADTIQFFAAADQVIAVSNVNIKQGSLNAESDSAEVFSGGEEISLFGNVRASQHNSELTGKQMIIKSQEKNLEKIEVYGGGEAVFRQLAKTSFENDSLIFNESRLTADRIDFFFANDLLHLIKAQGNSYTYYTPAPEDTTASGTNIASGDSTTLLFLNAELSEVKVVTSAEGIYMNPVGFDSTGTVALIDTIAYKADRIHFKIAERLIKLEQTAQVKQQTITLDAHKIDYDLNTKIVFAYAEPDTIPGKFKPLTLTDRTEAITGEELVYNLSDRRGKIKKSRTKLEQAFYSSNVLRKEEEDELLVKDGTYTTCEDPDPHFHFQSSSMKLVTNDKVFARPVVLYIESLPVLALPYFVFSIKKERHSGFLPLQFGNFERGSRFVNNVGYYWAVNDYWDLKTSMDISDIGLKFNSGVRYALRYKLAGSVSASYARETVYSGINRGRRTRGQLSFTHSHTIDPTLTMSGSGTFVSDKSYFTDFSTDLDERLDRQLRSQFSISKRWESASFTAAVDQTKDLDNNAHSERLPSLRFSRPQRPLFGTPVKALDKRWFHDIYVSYDNSLINSQSKSVLSSGAATRRKYAAFDQNLRFNAPLKAGGIFTVSPSVSLRDDWYYLPYSDQADSLDLQTNSLHSRQTWNAAIGLSTNLYGTVAPNVLAITGLRHVITPSASFNYQPEINRNREYASFTGFGSSGGESKNVSFRLANQFQMKYLKDEKEQKVTFLNYDVSASYDFVRDERRWSDVSSSLRAPTVKNLTLQISMTHDLYNPSTGELRWWSPYLKSMSINTGYSGSFSIPVGKPTDAIDEETGSSIGRRLVQYTISQRYTETRTSTRTTISNWVDFAAQFSITKNWRISYRQNYNVRERESTEKVVELHRDLHCWEGTFTWIPDGSRQGYYFKLSVKQLPDIKFEKSESGIRDALFGGISAFQQ